MSDPAEFSLRINGFTPDTLPMERLAGYMAQLSRLLGSEPKVHFVKVADGSALLVSKADEHELSKITKRIQLVKIGVGTNEARAAFQRLDDMLLEDGTDAQLEHRTSNLLFFPGKARVIPETFDPVIQEDSLEGVLISVGGRDDSVPVHLADGAIVYKCNTTRAKARSMAPNLFGPVLRVYGTASWRRDSQGMWRLNTMDIEDFEELNDDPIEVLVARLRAIPGNDWSAVDDPYAVLRELRGTNN